MSSEALNSITPGNVYKISEQHKNHLNKALSGYLSSCAFVRKHEQGHWLIKPATRRDKYLILEIMFKINIKLEEVDDD